MKDELGKLHKEAEQMIRAAEDLASLEKIEVEFLGRKDGKLNNILKGLKDLSPEEKKAIGQSANELKEKLVSELAEKRRELEQKKIAQEIETDKIDLSLPVSPKLGSIHPSAQIQYELEDIFSYMGFIILDGPELESDYYNFEALNIPEHHPARDMQDTFYVKTKKGDPKQVLRTHTSPMQVRAMQKYGAPLRAVGPGRVFRYEALDASHDNTFYQLEGIMVDKNLSITNLIAVMKTLLKGIFKKDVKVRLRPGFFPFVEPGFELDINCLICGGRGCPVCKQSGWVELLPCGMIHPNVLKAGNIDPNEYSGFAFGLGLTRLVMMRYGIDDIRLLNSGDLRFLKQF